MIEKTVFIQADGVIPYRNQAVEEYLLKTVEPGECIMYLWQNQRTVVIGRNQNGRAECRVNLLEEDGGYLARRLSGGGAVFHDLGNVNFSFIASDPDYSVEKQLEVIQAAVGSFGLRAELSGRNDLTIDGRKFSGNAYMSSGKRHCHHGTLLISADTSSMSKYLNVSQSKLESKGVRSVRSRVMNLSELNPDITADSITNALYKAFAAVYNVEPEQYFVSELDSAKIDELTEKFSSEEWRLYSEPAFSFKKSGRFAWGGVDVFLQVSGGKVTDVKIFTDALSTELPEIAENALRGVVFSGENLHRAILQAKYSEKLRGEINDISTLLLEAE